MADELFPPLNRDIRQNLELVPELVDTLYPVPARFRSRLPRDIRTLSRLLTGERERRRGGYLGEDAHFSAYLRYFLPWNLYRLCRLLPALPFSLKAGDKVLDMGSGPLTFPIALLLSRPDLQELELVIRCVDWNARILSAGRNSLMVCVLKFPVGGDRDPACPLWRPYRRSAFCTYLHGQFAQ